MAYLYHQQHRSNQSTNNHIWYTELHLGYQEEISKLDARRQPLHMCAILVYEKFQILDCSIFNMINSG